jgi:hypothetical protein
MTKEKLTPIVELVGRYFRDPAVASADPSDQPMLAYRKYIKEVGAGNRPRNGDCFEWCIIFALKNAGIDEARIKRHICLWEKKRGAEVDIFVDLGTKIACIGCKTSGRERIGLDFHIADHAFIIWRHLSILHKQQPLFFILTRQEKNSEIENPSEAIRRCQRANDDLNFTGLAQLITILDRTRMKEMFHAIISQQQPLLSVPIQEPMLI